MLEVILFTTFGGLLLGSATMVVITSQAIQGALWLVLTFISAASLWILLNAEFLGLILILVYVGAILTLFLFVIMTLTTKTLVSLHLWEKVKRYSIASSTVLTLLLCLLYSFLRLNQSSTAKLFTNRTIATEIANTQSLGIELYTVYTYPFELIGILLLAAIIVSISLSEFPVRSDEQQTKSIQKKDQLKANSKNRIRLVSGD